jgi:hypothetical protein
MMDEHHDLVDDLIGWCELGSYLESFTRVGSKIVDAGYIASIMTLSILLKSCLLSKVSL